MIRRLLLALVLALALTGCVQGGQDRRTGSPTEPLPSDSPATARRSIIPLTELSRSRNSAARSKSRASEASCIFASRSSAISL